MQSISPVWVEAVFEYKAKVDAGEQIQVKTYYLNALKRSLIDDHVKNFERRVRNLVIQYDFNRYNKKIQDVCNLY